MPSWMRWLGSGSDAHPSDEQIVALIDGQLAARQHPALQHHVESCWRCLTKRQQMEATIFALVERRNLMTAGLPPLSPRSEERLLAQMEKHPKSDARGWTNHLLGALGHLSLETMNPIVATALVVILAVSLLFMIWQRKPETLNAQDLLSRAQSRELAAAANAQSELVCQKIVIRSRSQVLERTFYYDARHRRPARIEHLDAKAEHVKRALLTAGLNWDSPLSAVDYSRWRAAQSHAQDQVKQGADGLVTVITTVPAGAVAEESITLRIADLHPVSRTVDVRNDVRNQDRFEIAELSYTPLLWSQLDSFSAVTKDLPHFALPAAVRTLTAGQLDEAELGARLALNRLHADASEQIEIARAETGVSVTGVVETAQRKLELDRALRQVPHVVPSLSSVEQLSAHRSIAEGGAAIEQNEAPAGAAPLEKFFQEQARTADELSQISEQLLTSALAAQQESAAIKELSHRFAERTLSPNGKDALHQLVLSHAHALRSALSGQQVVIARLFPQLGEGTGSGSPAASSGSFLALEGARDVALCKELISSSAGTTRSAQSIASDMISTAHDTNHALDSLIQEMGVPE